MGLCKGTEQGCILCVLGEWLMEMAGTGVRRAHPTLASPGGECNIHAWLEQRSERVTGAGRPGLAAGSSRRPWAAARCAQLSRIRGLAADPFSCFAVPQPDPQVTRHPLPRVGSRAGALQN